MTQPLPEPQIDPVSYRVDFLGFNVNAVREEDGTWGLQGPAIDLVGQLSQHGGPAAQLWRWPSHEEAVSAAVTILGGGASFVRTIMSASPDNA
jgi:hypothetical protein